MDAEFPVSVAGIGEFTFRRRTIRDTVAIEAEKTRILGGPCDAPGLLAAAHCIAHISQLLVSAPQGWSVEHYDPVDDPENIKDLYRIGMALRDAEATFRQGDKAGR